MDSRMYRHTHTTAPLLRRALRQTYEPGAESQTQDRSLEMLSRAGAQQPDQSCPLICVAKPCPRSDSPVPSWAQPQLGTATEMGRHQQMHSVRKLTGAS